MKVYQVKPGILSREPLHKNQKPMTVNQITSEVMAKFLNKEAIENDSQPIFLKLRKHLQKHLAEFNTKLVLFELISDEGFYTKQSVD